MPNPIIRLLNRFKIWRMQRRGDALVDVKPFFDTMIDLADEIIQEPQSEIPRDLFIMLAYVFAAKEGQGRRTAISRYCVTSASAPGSATKTPRRLAR